jgi:hypothetical protein
LVANLVRTDIQVTYLEGRLASLDAALAEPKVSFGTLISDQGDVALELYFTRLAERILEILPGDWDILGPLRSAPRLTS